MRYNTNVDSQYDYLTDTCTTDEDDDIVLESNADTHHESMRVVIHTRSDAEMRKQYSQKLDNLRRRNQVLCTLCGLQIFGHVLRSSIRIQSVYRGHLLREDKKIFDRGHSLFLQRCRTKLARMQILRIKRACVTIQSHFRGKRARKEPIGSATARIIENMRDIRTLESVIARIDIFRTP
jgi:hypothetical protein